MQLMETACSLYIFVQFTILGDTNGVHYSEHEALGR